MGAAHSSITVELADFIAAQPMFFVATAPLSGKGHINLSPKGLESFAVLSAKRVAYLDLTGSGNETAAHLLENGRITIMFCAFAEPPKILRLYGSGKPVRPDEPQWKELAVHFREFPGARQIIVVDVDRVHTSCGFGVPMMQMQTQRTKLLEWARQKGTDGVAEYQRKKNSRSIDGLPTSITAE